MSRQEKERLVINLAEEGRTTNEIAKEVRISLKDIGNIIRKATGEDEKKEKEKRRSLSPYAQAFQMFKDKLLLADVAIELDIKTDTVLSFYADYLRLIRIDGLVRIYQDLGKDFPLFFHLYRRIKKEGLGREDITELVESQQDLKYVEKRVELYNEHIRGQQMQVKRLDQVIDGLKSRIGNYDGTSL